MDKSPIFIGGLMKTGTSLLRKLMAGHPNIFGGLETFWFSEDMLHNWRDAGSKRQQFLRDFFDISESDSEGIRAQSESGIDFFDRCMWFCTQRAAKQRWVEKTPDNILHMGLIREHWPKAHFLHVVRDFRDVFASWKRRDKSLDEFITKTHEVMGAVGDLAGQRTNWYAEIRYDGLVMNTEQTLKEAIEFVGEPWVEGAWRVTTVTILITRRYCK